MGIRVFHCDDSEAFTRLVAFWLAEHEDIEHVGEAHNAESALALLPEARPDVVLLDTLGRPGDDTLLNEIRDAVPGVKVIVYSGYVRLMQDGALGRTWQEAAQGLSSKKSGMYLLGMFVGQQFEGEAHDDLDFFNFPEVDSNVGADTLDAPIDGFMLSKSPKNKEGSQALLEYLASGEAQNTYLQSDPNNIATAKDADTSGYNALQKKAVELIGNASNISQFMDRDTRPDFASTVMIPSIQQFIKNPNDINGLLKQIEDQKKTIFTS